MYDLVGVQLAATFGAFLGLVGVGTLPFCLVRCSEEWAGSTWLLSVSNCFACGVFLSTSFLGLIPHVREHRLWLQKAVASGNSSQLPGLFDNLVPGSNGWWSELRGVPETEALVLLGFLFILVLEQVMAACHALSCKRRRRCAAAEEFECRPLVAAAAPSTNPFLDSEDSEEEEEQIAIKRGGLEAVSLAEEEAAAERVGKLGHAMAKGSPEPPSLSLRSLMLLLGLGIHSIFEGLALGLQTSEAAFSKLLAAVMLHEVLCAVAFGLSLAEQRTRFGSAFLLLVALAMSIPLGLILGLAVPKEATFHTVFARYILEGLAAGIFIYVACVEMLAPELGHAQGGHSHGHSQSSSHSHHSHHSLHQSQSGQSSTQSGLGKALAVLLGFFTFIAFSFLSHH